MREARGQRGDLGGDLVHQPACLGVVVGLTVDRAVLGLHRADPGDRVLQREPVLVQLHGVGRGRGRGGRAGDVTVGRLVAQRGATRAGGPGDDVGPQRPVVQLLDRVVTEQVGVGEDHDPALVDLQRRGQRLAGRVRGGAGGGDDLRARRAVEPQDTGTVEAGVGHAGEQALADGGADVGQHPGRDVLVPAGALLHGGAGDRDPEAAEQLLQVVAVLVLVALREHDQAAAAADERLDEVQLVGGRAAVSRRR